MFEGVDTRTVIEWFDLGGSLPLSDSASADTMTVAGVTVTLNSSTRLFYLGAGAAPTLTGLFSAITPNTSVAAAFGTPGSMAGTMTAADVAVLRPDAHWED